MPDSELLKPGDFAARARLSPKALRLYAAQRLLVPEFVDERNGYRYYAEAQLDRARLIALLRRAGMPLARVRDVLELDGPALTTAIGRWWLTVEHDLRVRRDLVRYVDRYLTERQELMYDVQLRDVPEQKLLTIERRITVEGLDEFIDTAAATITEHLDAAGTQRSEAMRVIYHGMVTEDSDGPVEVAVPFTGSVEPAGELRVRLQPAGPEAFTRLTRAQGEFPVSSTRMRPSAAISTSSRCGGRAALRRSTTASEEVSGRGRTSWPSTGTVQPGAVARIRQVRRTVQIRRSSSSLTTIWYVAIVLPVCSGVHTAVTKPVRAARWCVALSSKPTAARSGPACMAAATEPSVSASTQDAPPCSRP